MTVVKILFCLSILLVFYTYIVYGMVLWLILIFKRRFFNKQTKQELPLNQDLPEVTLMICAYNEEDVVQEKMTNTRSLDYPKDKFKVMWVTDGTTDHTNDLLKQYDEVTIVFTPERKGKTAALNHGISTVTTPIVVMTDANTMLNSGAIKEIVREFMDEQVGCVSGEKRVMARDQSQTTAQSEGLYWKYESTLKRWDSELNSAMGAAGELCAIRTTLYQSMPEDTLLDDFIMSMKLVEQGYKIAYTPDAYAMEYGSSDATEEGKRKRRIAAGGLQSIARLTPLLNPFRQPLATFQYVSHRVLRWSITPIALIALIPLNIILATLSSNLLYTCILILQILFYCGALWGRWLDQRGKKQKLLYVLWYFLFMNINVFRGMRYLSTHKNSGAWEKAKRG